MAEFVMPSLGADMEAGTLVVWRKQPGDAVERGDIIAEVDTDKGLIEVEVFTSGVVEELLVREGTKVPVGTPLALIREEAKTAEPPRPRARLETIPDTPLTVRESVPPATLSSRLGTTAPGPHLRISPAARQLASELGVDVALLTGTGPDGAITREDVKQAAGARPTLPQPPALDAKQEARARMRQAIAAAMARSNREIPHYYAGHSFSFEPASSWLSRTNATRPPGERLVYGVLLLKAVALALHDFPELNARWENDHFVPCPQINVGMAIALREGGLVIPAILDTDRLSLDELMQKLRDLVERSRRGQLRSSELSEGTITVTSLGERGVESVAGVIYPPQTALLGFGAPLVRPWVVDDVVVPRPVMQVSLAADHRASDGHRGSLYLAALEKLLMEPSKL